MKWMKRFPYFWYLGMFPVISPIIIFTLQNFSSSCYAAQNGCDFQHVKRNSLNKASCHKKHSNDIPPRLKVYLIILSLQFLCQYVGFQLRVEQGSL